MEDISDQSARDMQAKKHEHRLQHKVNCKLKIYPDEQLRKRLGLTYKYAQHELEYSHMHHTLPHTEQEGMTLHLAKQLSIRPHSAGEFLSLKQPINKQEVEMSAYDHSISSPRNESPYN